MNRELVVVGFYHGKKALFLMHLKYGIIKKGPGLDRMLKNSLKTISHLW